MSSLKTVLVLGASYAGHRAIHVLVQNLPPGWRVVVIERNTHANHLYVFPRIAVLHGHEHKAFIPYTNIFKPSPIKSSDAPEHADAANHLLIHGHVTYISDTDVEYVPLGDDEQGTDDVIHHVKYDYLVYALGSHLPAPINIWSETPDHPPPKLPRKFSRLSSTAGSSQSSTPPSSTPSTPDSLSNFSAPSTPRGVPAALRGLGGLEVPSTPPAFHSAAFRHDPFGQIDLTKLSIVEEAPASTYGVQLSDYQQGTKKEGVQWLQAAQQRVKDTESVLVIGGGALGVQFASDIAAVYPDKKVTLVHSGSQLLPRFDKFLHDETLKVLTELGVDVMLNSRVDLSTRSKSTLRTCDGRLISAELILLCTGQKPNTSLLASIAPHSINPRTGMVSVLRSMQLGYHEKPRKAPHVFSCAQGLDEAECHCRPSFDFGVTDEDGDDPDAHDPERDSPYPNVFVIGDAADAFGALNAGHTAWAQAEVAAKNIVKLIKTDGRARVVPPASSATVSAQPVNNVEVVGLKLKRREAEGDGKVVREKLWKLEESKGKETEATVPEEERLERYVAPLPSIKVSLGLDRSVYQTGTKLGARGAEDCPLDLAAPNMWKRRGLTTDDMTI